MLGKGNINYPSSEKKNSENCPRSEEEGGHWDARRWTSSSRSKTTQKATFLFRIPQRSDSIPIENFYNT